MIDHVANVSVIDRSIASRVIILGQKPFCSVPGKTHEPRFLLKNKGFCRVLSSDVKKIEFRLHVGSLYWMLR